MLFYHYYSALITITGEDWAAWLLPGGPVGPPTRWAATPNVEIG